MDINRDQRRHVIQTLRDILGGLHGADVGILGLAFKPNTDDMRGAPSIEIAHMLRSAGANVRGYDPVAGARAKALLPELVLVSDAYAAAAGADALIIVTEWNEFKFLDLERLRDLMRRPVIVDGRNVYDPAAMDELGFTYRGIGRGGTPGTVPEAREAPKDQAGPELQAPIAAAVDAGSLGG
jgi:UDPglucose 6-dehydrogenase